jgi:hypothetical protein
VSGQDRIFRQPAFIHVLFDAGLTVKTERAPLLGVGPFAEFLDGLTDVVVHVATDVGAT